MVDYDAKKILQHLPPLHSLHFEYKGARLTDSFLVNVDVRLLRRLTISGVNVHEVEYLFVAKNLIRFGDQNYSSMYNNSLP